jgi:hypothetical protein
VIIENLMSRITDVESELGALSKQLAQLSATVEKMTMWMEELGRAQAQERLQAQPVATARSATSQTTTAKSSK